MIVRAMDNHGVYYPISANTAFALTEVKGINPPKASINTEEYATSDGAVFNSARLRTRNIVLTMYPMTPVEAGRMAIYNIFRPKQMITLLFDTKSRSVVATGYVESVEVNAYTNPQKVQVSVICPDPNLRGGSVTTPINPGSYVEITNPGEVTSGGIFIIYNKGQAFTDITFKNYTTNQSFTIDYDFAIGDSITIDTRQGQKSVMLSRNGASTNLLNSFSGDWVQIGPSYNYIELTLGSGDCGSMIVYNPLFEGV